MTEPESTRMRCLEMAVETCGTDCEWNYVIEAAREYLGFVTGVRANLRVVSNDDGDGV